MSDKKTRQHYDLATGGGAKTAKTSEPSPRFFGEGGYVRTGNHAHTTHGAPRGFSNKVGKNK